MATIASLAVKLLMDAGDFQKELDNTQGKISGFAKNVGSSMATLGKVAVGGLAVAGTAAAAFGVKAIGAASDLSESVNKVSVVFGESSQEILDWSKNAAGSLGQSQQQALEAVGTFGNLFTSMKIGQDVSADMSQGLVQLASDLASFNNIDPAVALEKLRAGITGETEPLKALGINLSAAAIEAKAFELGLVEMTEAGMVEATEANIKLIKAQENYEKTLADLGPLAIETAEAQIALTKAQDNYDSIMAGSPGAITAAAKAQAAYALIMDQSTNAQGDFARTADGLANSQRIIKAQFADITATLGSLFLPIAEKVVGFLSNLASQIVPKVGEVIEKLQLPITFLGQAFDALVAGDIQGVFSNITAVVANFMSQLGASPEAIQQFATFMLSLPETIERFKTTLVEALAPIIEWGKQFFSLKDVLITVGIAIAAVVIPIIASLVASVVSVAAPILLIIAVVALLRNAWENNWGGIQEKTRAVIEFVKGVITAGLQFIQAFWDQHGAAIIAIATKAWEFIKNIVDQYLSIIRSIFDAFKAAFEGDWVTFGEKLREAWDKAWNLILTVIQTIGELIIKAMVAIITTIIEKFKTTDWKQVGLDIINGLVNGIKSGAIAVKNAVLNIAKAAWDAVTGFFGAKSPSKLMFDLGEDVIEGWIQGMLNKQIRVIDVLNGLNRHVLETMGKLVRDFGSTGETLISIFEDTQLNKWKSQLDKLNQLPVLDVYAAEERYRLIQKIADAEQEIVKFREQQQKMQFLQAQLDLINQLREAGLDPAKVLKNFKLGFDASVPDIIRAMNVAMDAIIRRVNSTLSATTTGLPMAMEAGLPAVAAAGPSTGLVFHIDARGAEAGVERRIEEAVERALFRAGIRANAIRRTR